MEFTPIDMATWYRTEAFHYYTQMAPTSYTINISLDVSILRKALKEKGFKFFPAYLYLVTRALGQQQEFCIGNKDGEIGAWDSLTPMYPQFHENDKSTSLLWTEYNEDFQVFYDCYIEDTRQYGDGQGMLTAKGIPPGNSYVISCIPWFSFQSFSLHNHGIKDYYFPSFEAGKFYMDQQKILMPLSITVHHATIDGYQLKVFIEELQKTMDKPENWLG